MKKWIMPIAVVAISILAVNVATPICLADGSRIEIEGKLEGENNHRIYRLGDLHKGDEVKVAITNLRGDGNLIVYFSDRLLLNPFTANKKIFSFPGDATFEAPEDGNYYLQVGCTSGETVIYKGYATIENRNNTKGGGK